MQENYFRLFENEPFLDLNIWQCGQEKCSPCYSYGPVMRNHYLFHLIISGKGTFQTDTPSGIHQTYTLGAGDGFMIFPGTVHTYTADADDPWHYIWIEFDGLQSFSLISQAGFTPDEPIYSSSSRESMASMLSEMNRIVHTDNMSAASLIGHTYLFLDLMIRSSSRRVAAAKPCRKDYYVRQAISYIEKYYAHPNLSLEDAARFCNLNRSYLGKLFREQMNQTPQNFLINYRMRRAAELLTRTDMSVSEISKSVGYTSPLNFSRAFKSVFGCSPSAWRKNSV